MSENGIKLIRYLQDNPDKKLKASEIGEALGMSEKQINAIFTGCIVRTGLGERERGIEKVEDIFYINVQYLLLNEKGLKTRFD